MKYQSANSLVLIALWQFEPEHLIDLLYLEACREQILMLRDFLGSIAAAVVLVLYLTEYLLYYVLKAYDTRSASELVDNDSDALLLL